MMLLIVFKLLTCVVLCFGQQQSTQTNVSRATLMSREIIGNFSLELLYHTAKSQTDNIIMSPFNIWSVLTATAEGALLETRRELLIALRINKNRILIRTVYQEMARELSFNATTIKHYWFNGIFLHENCVPERDFSIESRKFNTFVFVINFTDPTNSTRLVNQAVSVATGNVINKLVDENDFSDTEVLVTSAAYFSGRWTTAFNVSSTSEQPFYDIHGVQIGEVNMMYNRHTYRFVDVPGIEAKVIELPYGEEEEVSMLVMLPYPGVSLLDMVRNFLKVPLNAIFSKLESYQQENGQVKVDCFIPRFTIESSLELKDALKMSFHIDSLFGNRANLGRMTRIPVHVGKVVHKALIDVSEAGINGPANNSEFTNVTGVPRFEANRPFAYFVVGKKMSTVLYQGIYQQPYLY